MKEGKLQWRSGRVRISNATADQDVAMDGERQRKPVEIVTLGKERRVGDRGEDIGIVFKLGEAVKEKFGSSDLVIGE